MNDSIINIVPFDIGRTFLGFEKQKYSKEKFIKDLKIASAEKSYIFYESNDSCFLTIKLSKYITCKIFDFGVGVFILKHFKDNECGNISFFENSLACNLYYKKKLYQTELLNFKSAFSEDLEKFMEIVWDSVDLYYRTYSSSFKYKNSGLSYVLSIYHIIDDNRNSDLQNQFDLLMNPYILGDILDDSKWEHIASKIKSYNKSSFDSVEFNECSRVITSWSAVAVVDNSINNEETLNFVIDYECKLQASWFLFDILVDNVEHNVLNNVELQQFRSVANIVELSSSNIMSANMSTRKKKVMEKIYDTSGIEIIKNKCIKLLDNRIDIENAKMSRKQVSYGIVTEIILLTITVVQIYQPVNDFINGEFSVKSIFVCVIMLIILAIGSVLIIWKEK